MAQSHRPSPCPPMAGAGLCGFFAERIFAAMLCCGRETRIPFTNPPCTVSPQPQTRSGQSPRLVIRRNPPLRRQVVDRIRQRRCQLAQQFRAASTRCAASTSPASLRRSPVRCPARPLHRSARCQPNVGQLPLAGLPEPVNQLAQPAGKVRSPVVSLRAEELRQLVTVLIARNGCQPQQRQQDVDFAMTSPPQTLRRLT